MARPKELIGTTNLPDGQELRLTFEQGYFHLFLDGIPLMSSAAHHSEERLAELGCEGIETRPDTRVLVGGLGMGYTLRAALDRTSATSRVVVAELVPAVIEWNRGRLADLAGRPLEDPRTQLVADDIVTYIGSQPPPFDAILLDTDNGPDDFTAKGNRRLYDAKGLGRLYRSLRPGGRLVVWSAYECHAFVGDLRHAGFDSSVVKAKGRGRKGARHTLYVGRRPHAGESLPQAAPRKPNPGRKRRR